MTSPTTITVTVPNVALTLDQLLGAIRQLDDLARVRVAETLLETEMDAKLTALLQRLTERQPATIADADIHAEIRAVRLGHA